MRLLIVGGIAVSAYAAAPAHASCDYLGLSDQAEDVIVGEIGSVHVSDLHRNCEVAYDAFDDLPHVDAIHCEDGDDPIHEW